MLNFVVDFLLWIVLVLFSAPLNYVPIGDLEGDNDSFGGFVGLCNSFVFLLLDCTRPLRMGLLVVGFHHLGNDKITRFIDFAVVYI